MNKLNFKKIKELPAVFLSVSAKKPFLAFLFLTVVFLFFSGVIFYKYGIIATREDGQTDQEPVRFAEDLFNVVSNIWEERDRISRETETKTYPDPFYVR